MAAHRKSSLGVRYGHFTQVIPVAGALGSFDDPGGALGGMVVSAPWGESPPRAVVKHAGDAPT